MRLLAFLPVLLHLLFQLGLSVSSLAQNDSIDESIAVYDKLCPVLGGDSVRLCNGVKCVGLVKDYYPDGQMKHKGYYDQGKIVSVFTNYYDNGQIERDFKIKSDIRGSIILYYRNGSVKSKGEYLKGEVLKWEDYYENGQVEYAEEFDKGMEYQLYSRFYYENGKPQIIFELTDDKSRIYEYTEYYENGQVKESGRKIQNKSTGDYQQDGIWKYYNQEGKLILEEEYIKGMLNSETKH